MSDLEYNMSIEYQRFLDGSRKSTQALIDIDKFAKKSDASLNDLYNTGVALGGGMTKTAQAVGAATNKLGNMNGAISNLSYQLQDMSVQAQMGTDALIILGQQGPQIASIFGAGGAVVGALIAVGALLAGQFTSSVKVAEKSIDEMIESISELEGSERKLLQVKLSEELGNIAKEANMAYAKNLVLRQEIAEQEKILKKLNDGTATGWLTDLVTSSESVEEKIASLNTELVHSDAVLAAVNSQYDKYKETLDELMTGNVGAAKATKEATDSFFDLSQSMSMQISLLGKSEREQAKLTAAYELGTGATKEQIQAVNVLIDAYYNELELIEEKEDKQKSLEKEAKKNAEVIKALSDSYEVAKLSASGMKEEAFILAQTQKLGASATKEQREEVEKLAAALFLAQEQQKQEKPKAKMEDQSQGFLDSLMEQQATELELIAIHEQAKLDKLMEYYILGQYTYEQYQQGLTLIGEQAAAARTKLAEFESRAQLGAFSTMFGNLSALMSTESRKMFEIGKTAAIAQTIISTYSAAQKSYESMASIPYVGPALGAAAAAAAIVGGLARVSAIESQSFSRGSVSNTGNTVPSTPTSPQTSQGQNITLDLNITGTTSDSFTQAVVESLNNAVDNGYSVKVS